MVYGLAFYMQTEARTREQMVFAYECDNLGDRDFPSFWHDPFCRKDFSRDRLRRFIPRLGLAMVWYTLCVYVDCVSQAWLQANMAGFYESGWGRSKIVNTSSEEWLEKHKGDRVRYEARTEDLYANQTVTLFDMGFILLPAVSSDVYANFFASFSIVMAVVRYFLIPGPMSMRWTIATRALVIWGLLFLIRSFVILITPLPNPYHQCVPEVSFPKNIWMEGLAFILPFWGSQLTCQDVLYSGHTVCGTMWTLFCMRYMQKAPWFRFGLDWSCPRITAHVFGWMWLVWGWYVIIGSHFHYSVDVMLAALLTFTVYSAYHNLIFVVWVRSSPFDTPITVFIRWFEQHSFDIQQWHMVMDLTINESHILPRSMTLRTSSFKDEKEEAASSSDSEESEDSSQPLP